MDTIAFCHFTRRAIWKVNTIYFTQLMLEDIPMSSGGHIVWSGLSWGVLQLYPLWKSLLMLLYQQSQDTTCLLFIPQCSDCHGCDFQHPECVTMGAFFYISSTCFSGLRLPFTRKYFRV
jgi:hypothetical protein